MLLNNLVRQVKRRMKNLPYEITKCFPSSFQLNDSYKDVSFDTRSDKEKAINF